MHIALAQLDGTIGHISGALVAIRAAAVQAAGAGAALLVCPELAAMGGYPPRDLCERRWLIEEQWAALNELAKVLPLPVIVGCIEPLEPGIGPGMANAVALLDRGEITATYHKRLLPTYDVFDERRYFRVGDGPVVVEVAGLRLGLTICEDIWSEGGGIIPRYRQDPVQELAGRCDAIINCSASPWHLGKEKLRRRVVIRAAKRAKVPVVYVNQVGAHDELLFDGDSGVAFPDGSWSAAGRRWKPGVALVDLAHPEQAMVSGAWEVDDPSAALHQALITGLRGYCTKTGQSQVVLGLSGGIDSALVAALAADALGADNVTGLLMPGPYSSPGSLSDAAALATALGIRTHTLPISALNAAALSELAPVFTGTAPGLAEENLQARLRGLLVMAVANKRGAMALTTGNKSEIACGYCTIYGDTNGGLAPIGDLYKTQVWELSRWINRRAGSPRIPEASITKPPSAELRPDQTDQDSLPPYPVLDRILHLFLEEGLSPAEIISRGEDAATVALIVRLVETTEWKRRQMAPVLRVSAKAFGVGRRMPIARAWERRL